MRPKEANMEQSEGQVLLRCHTHPEVKGKRTLKDKVLA